MNRLPLIIVGIALALTSGCLLEDRFGSGRMISVTMPSPDGTRADGLTGNEPEVQEALTIIDSVLAPEGLTRDANPSAKDPNGLIAYYHHSPERPSSCGVFIDDHQLNVVFRERQHRDSSPEVRRISASLTERLRARFGDKQVSVK
jgi:hypothetical protein